MRACQQRVNARLWAAVAPPSAGYSDGTLSEAMTYACAGSGKRIRPLLAYASALAVGGSIERADAAATAVELIHCYSLVHDDLPAMDDDDLRRGKPTVHKAFDEATAILVGDALQALAFELVAASGNGVGPEQRLGMVSCLASAAGAQGMVGGQALDFAAVGEQQSVEQLQQMHNLKTGALIRAAVSLGALSHAATSPAQLAALDDYAAKLGLAFQVRDDILDEISDTATLGKPQGSDSSANKPTYLSLLGLDAARAKAEELAAEAVEALNDFDDRATPLRQLAQYIVARLH
ncbi:MAG: polyprenyl synthetase family protein [Gammaproteobacteria bacterium]|nr:polyprenyl synthetase family protein [Gammaproteobacteria bacterium]